MLYKWYEIQSLSYASAIPAASEDFRSNYVRYQQTPRHPLPRSSGQHPLQKHFFMQLYVDRNRSKSEALLKKINELGMKAIFVTVDAHAPGKREADERSRAEIEVVSLVYLRHTLQDMPRERSAKVFRHP